MNEMNRLEEANQTNETNEMEDVDEDRTESDESACASVSMSRSASAMQSSEEVENPPINEENGKELVKKNLNIIINKSQLFQNYVKEEEERLSEKLSASAASVTKSADKTNVHRFSFSGVNGVNGGNIVNGVNGDDSGSVNKGKFHLIKISILIFTILIFNIYNLIFYY